MKQVLFFGLMSILPVILWAQLPDTGTIRTVPKRADTLASPTVITDTIIKQGKDAALQHLLDQNKLLNSKDSPVSMAIKLHKPDKDSFFFYLLTIISLLLACLRFFYSRYFTNLFRVFFNTSLRQSQLTDQLLMAKLPSLLFNIFFFISGGAYLYFLLLHYQRIPVDKEWPIVALCMALLAVIYITKFCMLKFTGWVTGYAEATNIYVFIVFLINKIIAVFLVPFTIVMVFAMPAIAQSVAVLSILIVGVSLFMRLIVSYSLIQQQLKINKLHFFLYIIGIEILPLLLIYKAVIQLLSKNL